MGYIGSNNKMGKGDGGEELLRKQQALSLRD